jgi:hypothetical protein
MVKFSALAVGLLALASEACAQKTVKVMPFGASIVSVCSPSFLLKNDMD